MTDLIFGSVLLGGSIVVLICYSISESIKKKIETLSAISGFAENFKRARTEIRIMRTALGVIGVGLYVAALWFWHKNESEKDLFALFSVYVAIVLVSGGWEVWVYKKLMRDLPNAADRLLILKFFIVGFISNCYALSVPVCIYILHQ